MSEKIWNKNTNIDFNKSFKCQNKSEATKLKNQDTVKLLLSNFGSNIFNLGERFIQRGIQYKDLASLNREDLELLGVDDYDKQTEMLETFSELIRQDFTFEELKNSWDAQDYNSNIAKRAISYLDIMRMTLNAVALKLNLELSDDILFDERNFSSKFTLNALDGLHSATLNIEKTLKTLEKICLKSNKHNISISKKSTKLVVLGSIVILCVSFVIYKIH